MTNGRLPKSPLNAHNTRHQKRWQIVYCRGQGHRHGPALIWLCIELFLARLPGSSGLADLDFQMGSTRLVEYQLSEGLAPEFPADAAVRVDASYREFVLANAPHVLKLSRPYRRRTNDL